jgi:hypothetical protein
VCAVAPLAALQAREPVVRRSRERARPAQPAEDAGTVLEAEAGGLVKVSYIPNDSRSAQIIVQNLSNKPLSLRLPDAFVGVPVLAQMGMGGMGGGGMGGGGMGGFGGGGMQSSGGGGFGNQGMNGGMGGGMGGMGGGMGAGGAFSIPPEKTRVLRVTTVCLEYGKHEPVSRVPYRMQAIESFSTDPRLAEVLATLGRGEISQKVAQAAAWHLANGLSWEQLAAERIDRIGRPDEPFFQPAELQAAHGLVAKIVAATPTAGEPGETPLPGGAAVN